ncbi:GNAT family N-acetyltransferase [Halospeciosus flavus]|uniref:GNAT family N-acetyltransferase n=1 Tax=Halospeciosus flavus TaxID=3032283 RepID=A0ABD5Z920_9EURY|nr:GNAT family N-acetyltransferase [Halospeciosus flavus]
MRVRAADESDVDAIRDVVEASWEIDYPAILSRERADEGVDEWYAPDGLHEAVDDGRTVLLVAEREESSQGRSVVGFVHGLLDGDVGHVLRIYVHPEHREAEVGTTLFEEGREALVDRGAERVRAMVLAENTPGNEFYRSLGLERVDEGETTIGGESYTENVYEA